jgi:hypothetical protein
MRSDGTMEHMPAEILVMCVANAPCYLIHTECTECSVSTNSRDTIHGNSARLKVNSRLNVLQQLSKQTALRDYPPFEPDLALHIETRQCLSKKHTQPRTPIISSLIHVTSLYLPTTHPENDGIEGKRKRRQPSFLLLSVLPYASESQT